MAKRRRRRKVVSAKIRDRLWTIELGAKLPDDRVGECDWNTRTIRVDGVLDAAGVVATLIHETLHASCDFLAEDAVGQIEADIVAVLQAAGVRLGA